jgi:flagellin-specific chaperone FliS
MEIVESFRYVESIEELMKELDHHAGNNLYRKVDRYRNNVKDTDHIFINFVPIENVWIIQKKNEIIEELNYVLRKCNTKGVTWYQK